MGCRDKAGSPPLDFPPHSILQLYRKHKTPEEKAPNTYILKEEDLEYSDSESPSRIVAMKELYTTETIFKTGW